MKSIKLYFIIISCVLSYTLGAQETYTWANEYGQITMYKHGFFNNNIQKMFSIPKKHFTHENMTDTTNIVNYFEFTKDRKQVYFLDRKGDLYIYNIASDSIRYICDLTPNPDTTNLLFDAYTKTLGLTFINDTILYIYGQTYGTFNIKTGIFKLIRQPPDFFSSVLQKEKEISSISILKYKDEFLYVPDYPHINELNLYNPDSNKMIYVYDSICRGFRDMTVYQRDCDSISLYILAYLPHPSNPKVPWNWYKIDMTTGEATYSHPSLTIKFIDKDFGLLQTKHYNAMEWEDCQRVIDLDEDDSTAPDRDFYMGGLCYHTDIILSDVDVMISNEYPLDSVDIEILGPRPEQSIEIPPGNYMVRRLSSSHKRLINTGTTVNSDYMTAIKGAMYKDAGKRAGGEVRVNFTAWYDGKSGKPATAIIDIVNPLPEAGDDSREEQCQNAEAINLKDLISEGANDSGEFYDKTGEKIDEIFTTADAGERIIYYIVTNQGCSDTARIYIKINPLPLIKAIGDTILCYGSSLHIDKSDMQGFILWNDGDTTKEKIIDAAGIYSYTVTNEYQCQASDTFEVEIMAQAYNHPVEAKVCSGQIFEFMQKEYSLPGIYHDTLRSHQGCDSVIYDIQLQFFEEIPIEYTGELGFCEGEKAAIKIISDHDNIMLEGEKTGETIEFSFPGTYKITAYDKNGCKEELDLDIERYPAPEVTTENILDIIYHSGIELPVEYRGNIVNYNWMPKSGLDCYDCPYPKLISPRNGIYIIEVTNEYGCTDKSEIELRFKELDIDIPNIIYNNPYTPNNGIFYIKSNTEVKYDLIIFNRWGNMIYSEEDMISNNPEGGWQPAGQVNPGVYIYMIKIIAEDGKEKIIAGDITVL